MYKVSAPGSLMLFGEHAVLHHHQAIVCAIDKRITITLEIHSKNTIEILSSLGQWVGNIKDLKIEAPFQFVLAACLYFKSHLKHGFKIFIESDFSEKIGFGSSAAITVTMVAVLTKLLSDVQYTKEEIFHIAKRIILNVQGVGSGADVAASLYGGLCLYKALPFQVEISKNTFPLTIIYSGYKTPTKEVIAIVERRLQDNPVLYHPLLKEIDKIVDKSWHEIKQHNFDKVADYMDAQHRLMQLLGVSTALLDDIVIFLRQQIDIKGAKISGAGLGDCVVGLGKNTLSINQQKLPKGIQEFSVEMSSKGLYYYE